MDYLTPAKGTSRWDPARFINYAKDTYDPCNSYMIDAILSLPAVGEYTVLDDMNRPDMICAAIYNDEMTMWWLLMLYNGLWDYASPYNYPSIPVGTVVRYFGRDDLERLYFGLRAKQLANPA